MYDKIKEKVIGLKFTFSLHQIIKKIELLKHIKDREKTICIGNLRCDRFYLIADCILAWTFTKFGYNVIILIDDGILSHYDTRKAKFLFENSNFSYTKSLELLRLNGEQPTRIKRRYEFLFNNSKFQDRVKNPTIYILSRLIKIEKVKFFTIRDLINRDILENGEYKSKAKVVLDGLLPKHVESSHRRCFGGRPFDATNKIHIKYALESLRNTIICNSASKRLINDHNPDLYISLDGNYSVYGSIREVMQNEGIPTLIYRPDGFKNRSIYIGQMPYGVNNVSDHWCHFLKNREYESLKLKTVRYLENRINLSEYILNPSDIKCEKIIIKKRKTFKKVIALFPNLTWDGAIKERDIIFESLDRWILETINWIENKDYLLVIREHPQPPNIYNKFESCYSLIKEIYPSIDTIENVLFIKGNEKVNSYYLLKNHVDCSVTYGGTLAIEIPYMGVPNILAANSPYSKKELAFEPENKNRYFELLEKMNCRNSLFLSKKESFRNNSIIAAAYQFFYNLYEFPIMPTKSSWDKDKYTGKKYWKNWDAAGFDMENYTGFKKTVERFLMPLSA